MNTWALVDIWQPQKQTLEKTDQLKFGSSDMMVIS